MSVSARIETVEALVIGAGPAGLMAAQELGRAGVQVVIVDAMPSPARKFLMAGKSGLNVTKNEGMDAFQSHFSPLPDALKSALSDFGPKDVIAWAEDLGQEVFTGSTGRVFPTVMKASPLLRAWLARLDNYGADLRRKWRLTGMDDTGAAVFQTPEGLRKIHAKATILALGGASWARLGSNGAWADLMPDATIAPFAPANSALSVTWSTHMTRHFGGAVKGVELRCGAYKSRGEFIISNRGLEGGGIYSVSRGVREGHEVVVDLLPDMPAAKVKAALERRKPKESLVNFLRKSLRLSPEKIAMVMEFARPLPDDLTPVLKGLTVSGAQLRPMDEAISTAGGLRFEGLTDNLEIKTLPNVFACGEMLDWEAPTGGYLINACLATGRRAGLVAIDAVTASKDE
ncbi:MAG: TIGR03862 family flavoprotein [Pacificibacter sp.]|uniref:NAD(P)/FAD-dependent oxidoreductase n=1 Tax=Pacificibacter sp. TaxID=1917866 RepID=UPI00321BD27F